MLGLRQPEPGVLAGDGPAALFAPGGKKEDEVGRGGEDGEGEELQAPA